MKIILFTQVSCTPTIIKQNPKNKVIKKYAIQESIPWCQVTWLVQESRIDDLPNLKGRRKD